MDIKKLQSSIDKHSGQIIKSFFIDLGITDSLIKRFFPTPYIRKNKWGVGYEYFYPIDEVQDIVKSQEFVNAFNRLQSRIKSAKSSASYTKLICDIENDIQSLEISLPDIPLNELRKRAILHWNQSHRRNFNPCLNGDITNKIVVDYIRHQLTSYDIWLYNKCANDFWKSNQGLRDHLHHKVNSAITTKYPELLGREK